MLVYPQEHPSLKRLLSPREPLALAFRASDETLPSVILIPWDPFRAED